jgi:hypothetical protein
MEEGKRCGTVEWWERNIWKRGKRVREWVCVWYESGLVWVGDMGYWSLGGVKLTV